MTDNYFDTSSLFRCTENTLYILDNDLNILLDSFNSSRLIGESTLKDILIDYFKNKNLRVEILGLNVVSLYKIYSSKYLILFTDSYKYSLDQLKIKVLNDVQDTSIISEFDLIL